MLPNGLTVAVTLKAFDEMSRVVQTATAGAAQHLRAFQDKVGAASAAMRGFGVGALGVGFAAGATLAKPIAAFVDLEEAVTRAKVAFLTETGIDLGFSEVQKVAERLGKQLPGTTADFTIMASKLKELGISTTTIAKGGLEATAYLRVLMGNLAPEAAAQMTATFKNSLNIADGDFTDFIDLVQRQKFAFGVDPQAFAYTLQYLAPQLQQLGVTGVKGAKDLMQMTGALAQAGLTGERLGTSLQSVILTLPDLGEKIAKSKTLPDILNKAGIAMKFFDGQGKFKGISNMVGQLEQLQKLNPQQRLATLKELFGSEAAGAVGLIVNQGVGGYKKAADELARQASLQDRLRLVMGTLRNTWDAFTGTLDNVLAGVGETFGQDLKDLTANLNAMADATGEWIKQHPALVRQIALGVAGFAAVATAVGGAAVAIGTIGAGVAFVSGGLANLAGLATKIAPHLAGFGKSIVTTGARLLAWRFPAGMMTGFLTWLRALPLAFAGLQVRLALTIALTRSWVVAQLSAARASFFTLTGLRSMGAALLGNVVAGLRGAALATRAFTLTLLANPLTWIALVAAVAAYAIYKYWKPISGFFRGLWRGIVEGAKPIGAVLGPMFASARAAIAPILAPLRGVWTWLTKLLSPVDDVGGSAEKMGLRWGKTIAGMLVTVIGLGPKLLSAGKTFMTMLASGITSGTGYVVDALSSALAKARAFLPFSPAKVGPLRDIHRIRLVETIAASVRPAPLVTAISRVAAAARQAAGPIARPGLSPAVAGAAARGGSGGGGGVMHFSPTIDARGAAPGVEASLKAMLQEMAPALFKQWQAAQRSTDRTKFER